MTIGQGVTNIGQGAFGGCHNLTSLTIGEGVEKIEAIAFSDCRKLTSIVLPTSVSSIGEAAFSACSSLTSIVIPGGVASIGNNVLADCGSLTSITVDANNAVYDSRNNCNAIIRTDDDELIAGCSTTIIPSDVMSIGYGAFAGCNGPSSITFPEDMVNIGNEAFRDCGNFTSVTISECITNIGTMAFSKCSNLSTVVCKATSSPRLGSSAFYNISSSSVLFVPEGSVPSYESAGWNNYFAIIEEIKTAVLATSLTLDATTASLAPDETLTLNATLLPADVTETTLSWTSTNEAVATVDANGVVTAVADGEATIIVSTTDGSNLSATCVVTVETEESGGEVIDTENFLSMEDLSVRAGSKVELSVTMNNEMDITSLQFDLVLPEGITVVQDEDGYELINLNTERTTVHKHTTEGEAQTDGSIRVICYSNSNAVFSGTEGEVMTITLNVSDEMQEGNYTIRMKDLVLTEISDGKLIPHIAPSVESTIGVFTYTIGDVNGDASINVTDISGIVNFILNTATDGLIEQAADVNEDGVINVTDISGVVNLILNTTTVETSLAKSVLKAPVTRSVGDIRLTTLPFALNAGEEKEIYVLLDNPGDTFTGIQFDLLLPDGVRVPTDSDGYYSVNLGSRTTNRKHVFPECTKQADGILRVLCYSNSNAIFTGEEGDVLVITVVGDEDLSGGVYDIAFDNIVLSRPNVTEYNPNDYTASVLVGAGGAEQDMSLNGIYTADVLADFSEALATNDKITSVDLTEAIFVAESGELSTGNPNTLIYLSEGAMLANESNVVCGDECANLALTDGYPFSTPTTFDAVQTHYTRTLNGTLWNALYLPFDVAVSAFGDKYDVACISKVEENEGDLVMVIERLSEGTLSANTPYFVRAKNIADNELSIESEGAATCAAEENTKTYTAGATTLDVVGNYQSMTSEELVGCYAISTQGMWQPAKDGSVLRSFRTYLKMSAGNGAPVKAIRIRTEGETTAIDNDTMHDSSEESGLIYDLQGRRVDNPTKGMYIVNGKKVLY